MNLRPHDRQSIGWLMEHKEAALFAGMGLGKTANTLLAFDGLRMMGLASAALIVAPMRVSTLTWPNEVAKWAETRHLRIAQLRTSEGMSALRSRSADLYLTNYERLPSLAEGYLKQPGRYAFDTVIFDELTAAKSHNSKRINRVRRLLTEERGVIRRWGLTGTPTPNSLLELYGQVRLLDGGKRFGPSFGAFQSAYFESTDYMQYNWVPKRGAKEKLYAAISDLALSLPTAEHMDYPEPVINDVMVPLPDEAREQYEELSKKLLIMLSDETEIVALSAGALLQKLLQVTGGSVYREDKTVATIHDAKLRKLKELVRKADGPVLIGCNYIHERERIARELPAIQFINSPAFLDSWNSGKYDALVAHPKSLGHGLNMQGGSHTIIWYSLPFSRELYDQFNARLARSGQKNRVIIHRILCPDTVDEAVVEALRQKDEGQQALMNALHNFKLLCA
jgi:SNF2 family DNA or RNA helicase